MSSEALARRRSTRARRATWSTSSAAGGLRGTPRHFRGRREPRIPGGTRRDHDDWREASTSWSWPARPARFRRATARCRRSPRCAPHARRRRRARAPRSSGSRRRPGRAPPRSGGRRRRWWHTRRSRSQGPGRPPPSDAARSAALVPRVRSMRSARQPVDIAAYDDERDRRQRGADCEHRRARARGVGAQRASTPHAASASGSGTGLPARWRIQRENPPPAMGTLNARTHHSQPSPASSLFREADNSGELSVGCTRCPGPELVWRSAHADGTDGRPPFGVSVRRRCRFLCFRRFGCCRPASR